MSFAQNGVDSCASLGDRYRMIKDIQIENFRCFRRFAVSDCALINVIVGENGVGKTALLEAIFWALTHSTDKAIALRQFRGNDPQIAGDPDTIVKTLFEEFFYKSDFSLQPRVVLRGSGDEARSFRMWYGQGDTRIPKGAKSSSDSQLVAPITIEWIDSRKKRHTASVVINPQGVDLRNTGEKLPNWMFFAAQTQVFARESANRYSELGKKQRHEFEVAFRKIFEWVEDIGIESRAGIPVLSATDTRSGARLPLSALSGGINRIAAILLAIANRKNGIVLIDEAESGIFFSKERAISALLLEFARQFSCQIFMTTHSLEWLREFIGAAGKKVSDISLWRIESSSKSGPYVQRFDGKTFKAGIEHGTEVRG